MTEGNKTKKISEKYALGDGFSRTAAKLDKRMADGEYYEAHQLYRTLYFRYIAQDKSKEAIDLLMKGALAMFDSKQISSGVDLTLLLVNTLEKNKVEVTQDNIEKVATLHRLLDKSHVERPNFVLTAMRWSKKKDLQLSSSNKDKVMPLTGHPMLHAKFALTYWHERDYSQSRYHFVRSNDGERCASMLIECHVNQGFPWEVDLFIAQAVFQFLCLQNKMTAEICFNSYTKQHPQVGAGPPYLYPLLNFLSMLLFIIDGGNLTIFTILCEQYTLSLRRDVSYNDYIARIGQLFFHLPIQSANGPNFFGNLLSSLLSGEDEEGCDEERRLVEPVHEDVD